MTTQEALDFLDVLKKQVSLHDRGQTDVASVRSLMSILAIAFREAESKQRDREEYAALDTAAKAERAIQR